MTNNFITNTLESITLKERLKKLQDNDNVNLKILVGLKVDKYLSGIVEVENKDDNLSREEHFA